MEIVITIHDLTIKAKLNQSTTAKAIASALPLSGSAHVWGREIYFDIPVDVPLSNDALEEVEVGDLAYWPTGRAFCIFFGPTPVSTSDKPRAYSPVNVFGHISGGTGGLNNVTEGSAIVISAID